MKHLGLLIQQLAESMKPVQRLLKCLRISSYFFLEISVAEIGSLNLVGSMRIIFSYY